MPRPDSRHAWSQSSDRPGQHGPSWKGHSHPARLFVRFAVAFGLFALLLLGVFGLTVFLVVRVAGGDRHFATLVWLSTCGLILLLPILAGWIGRRAFRRFAAPLAELMAAADRVAGGDLSVRLGDDGRGEFNRLSRSFNNMVTELDLADQRRRNLTADVAHELRTPLQIIQGNLEGVLDGVYQPTTEHISATLDETRVLARLVEDLRVLSQAEAGELPLKLESVQVEALFKDVITSFSGQAESKEITLDIVMGFPGEALTLQADYGRIDQVLRNLVANALRHTPAHGRVTLSAHTQGEEVILQVTDTGEGIAPEELPYIFDRFWRGDRSRTHTVGSSGLGLAIARQLVQAQNGQISVESAPGKGTIFTLAFPV